ncbi:enoyl-CoA hydratase/isomerase family protein [Actinomadura bangladeshensis]|uniref:Enoyl-CoA hydratase/isomerase family protein n=1 Tax=Actinomadura bangladeshensis TaxID=453573 RepID=A0A6L9QIF6_9ACTN|nr:enoyl-CoA hydratase/isomerase family protein [Actinomadura bangladeshensis]NEA23854.1 enoyl-CoA hydratase/isomerase family protein [Actinomadura bangladeshensis]
MGTSQTARSRAQPTATSSHPPLPRVPRPAGGKPAPSIAAVNGLARAGGFELLLACDFVIAASDAKVGDTHSDLGIVPGAGASQRAPRRLGDQRARALLGPAGRGIPPHRHARRPLPHRNRHHQAPRERPPTWNRR